MTDNPEIDFAAYDSHCCSEELKLPHCEDCGEAIDDDYFYEVNGDVLCEECLKDRCKVKNEAVW